MCTKSKTVDAATKQSGAGPFLQNATIKAVIVVRIALFLFQFLRSSTTNLHHPIYASLFSKPNLTFNQIREMSSLQRILQGTVSDLYSSYDFNRIPPILFVLLSPISAQDSASDFFLAGFLLICDVLIAFFIYHVGVELLIHQSSCDDESRIQLDMPEVIRPQNAHIFPCASSNQGDKGETNSDDGPLLPLSKLPMIASLVYLASPMTIMSSQVYGCYQNLPFLLLMASVYNTTVRKAPIASATMMALASHIELHYASFTVPLFLLYKTKGSQTQPMRPWLMPITFIAISMGLQGITMALVGTSQYTRVLTLCYGVGWNNLNPNLSVIWYFRMQLFTRFIDFYGYMITGLPFLLIAPLTKRLVEFPMVLVAALWLLFTIFHPMQTLYDLNAGLSLLLLNPRTLARMSGVSFVALCSMGVPLGLYVLDLWMWLYSGSGNANFIFFQCLGYNAFVGIILGQFCGASVQRMKALSLTIRTKQHPTSLPPSEDDDTK